MFLLQSDEELLQQVKKEKQEFASVQSKLKILEVYSWALSHIAAH